MGKKEKEGDSEKGGGWCNEEKRGTNNRGPHVCLL